MTFLEHLLSLAPAVCWPMDDALGAANARDATGNARVGTYNSAPTLEQASLVPNMPDSASTGFDGVDDYIKRTHEAWMTPGTSFTALFVYYPRAVTTAKDIAGKVESWQVWQLATGRLQVHISPAWTSFNNTSILVNNTPYLIVVRQSAVAARASVWVNGVKEAEVVKSNLLSVGTDLRFATSSIPGNGRPNNCRGQFFAYWPTTALSDADIAGLYASFIAPPGDPPDAPEILSPTAGEHIDRQLFVTVSDVTGTGTDGGNLQYKVEYEVSTGAGWATLIDWTSARPVDYLISTSLWAEGADYRIRAFARDIGESDPGDVVTFEVDHVSSGVLPGKPTLSWEWYTDKYVGFLGSELSSVPGAYLAKAYWEFDTDPLFPAPVQVTLLGERARLGSNLTYDNATGTSAFALATMFAEDTDVYGRVRYEDELGALGPFSDYARGRTSRIIDSLGSMLNPLPIIARDYSGNERHGAYYLVDRGGPGLTSPVISGQRYPVGLLPDVAAHAEDCGVFHDNERYVYANGLDTPFDVVGGIVPSFGILIRGFLKRWPLGVTNPTDKFGILGLRTSVRWTLWVWHRYVSAGEHRVEISWGDADRWLANTVELEEDEFFDLRITHERDLTTSTIKVNGETVYSGAPISNLVGGNSVMPIEVITLGNHGHIVNPSIGGVSCLCGVISDFAMWWNNLGFLELPENPTEDEISLLEPDLYWKLDDPAPPVKPVLTRIA